MNKAGIAGFVVNFTKLIPLIRCCVTEEQFLENISDEVVIENDEDRREKKSNKWKEICFDGR